MRAASSPAQKRRLRAPARRAARIAARCRRLRRRSRKSGSLPRNRTARAPKPGRPACLRPNTASTCNLSRGPARSILADRRIGTRMSQEVEILLVDDNASDVELTVRALRRHKLANSIHVAEDGQQALDFVFCRDAYSDRSFANPPKVIFLDLKMPKVDGIEVLRAIRGDARTKAIPVVILTSSKEQRDLVEGYKLGVNAYIQKPVDFDEFRRVIEQMGMFWLVVNQPPPREAFPAT